MAIVNVGIKNQNAGRGRSAKKDVLFLVNGGRYKNLLRLLAFLHLASFLKYFIFVEMLQLTKQRLTAIPQYVLILGLVVLPLVLSTTTLDPVLAPRYTYLGVWLVLLAGGQLMFKSKSLSLFKYTWPFLVFIALEALSLFNANTPSEGWVVLLRDAGLFIFMIVVVRLSQADNSIAVISKAMVLVNAIIGSYGLYQLLTINALMDETRLYEIISTLGHRNLFASALVLTLPFVIFSAWRKKGIWRWMSLVVFVQASFLIFVLESRTVWLAYFAFILSYPIWILVEKLIQYFSPRVWRSLFVALLVMGVSAFSWVYFANERFEGKGQELTSELGLDAENKENFTIDERVMLWKGTLRMIWNEDLGGVGAGNWKIMFPAYGSDIWRARQGMVQFQRPHNDYLWVLSETGILGLAAYLSCFILILFYGLKAVSNHRLDQKQRVMIRLLLSGVLAYLLVAFFSFPRERIFHQVVLYTLFGLLISLNGPAVSSNRYFSKISIVLGLVLGGMVIWVGANWWQGEKVVRKINEARAIGDWKGLLGQYSKVEGNRFYKMDAVSVPLSFYSGLAYLNLEKYPKSQSEFTNAYNLHPNNIHVINNMANIYFLQGEADSALVFYKKALRVSPKYLDGALNLMAAYFNLNQIEEAYAVLRKYEVVFRVDSPNHSGIQSYRLAILKAKKYEILLNENDEQLRNYLEFLTEQQLENLHFESLKQDVTLVEMIREMAYVKL